MSASHGSKILWERGFSRRLNFGAGRSSACFYQATPWGILGCFPYMPALRCVLQYPPSLAVLLYSDRSCCALLP